MNRINEIYSKTLLKKKVINDKSLIYIKSPFEWDVFISKLLISFIIFYIFLIILILFASYSSAFENFLSLFCLISILSIISMIFSLPMSYFHLYTVQKRDYYIQNGIIHIGGSPFFSLVFVEDIVRINYVTIHPYLVMFKYFKYYHGYYHQFINPPMSRRVYLVDLQENHKLEYEGKIYHVFDFNKKDWKKVSYRYLIIPKKVFDEYKNNEFYLPPNLTLK